MHITHEFIDFIISCDIDFPLDRQHHSQVYPPANQESHPLFNMRNGKERRPSRPHRFICRIASKLSQQSVWRLTTVSDQGRLSRRVDHITFIKLCVQEELNMETLKDEELVTEESIQDRGGDAEAAETFFAGWGKQKRECQAHRKQNLQPVLFGCLRELALPVFGLGRKTTTERRSRGLPLVIKRALARSRYLQEKLHDRPTETEKIRREIWRFSGLVWAHHHSTTGVGELGSRDMGATNVTWLQKYGTWRISGCRSFPSQ